MGEGVLGEEGSEALLERALGDRLADLALLLERALEGGDPPAVAVPRDEASRGSGLARRRISASLRACPSCWGGRSAARSRSVRAGLVTGMPASVVISSSGRATWCASILGCRHRRGPVISTLARIGFRIPHSAAAER
jgi:hypothetical protein